MRHGRENLKPFGTIPEDEQRKIQEKGGRASVESRRQRKAFWRVARDVLSLPMKEGGSKGVAASVEELEALNLTFEQALILSIGKKALDGDMGAARLILEVGGGKFDGLKEYQQAQIEKLRAEKDVLTSRIPVDLEQEGGGCNVTIYLPDNGRGV